MYSDVTLRYKVEQEIKILQRPPTTFEPSHCTPLPSSLAPEPIVFPQLPHCSLLLLPILCTQLLSLRPGPTTACFISQIPPSTRRRISSGTPGKDLLEGLSGSCNPRLRLFCITMKFLTNPSALRLGYALLSSTK